MRRDPTEFRERFAKWKDGERYWSIIGQPLPHYEEGKDDDYESLKQKLSEKIVERQDNTNIYRTTVTTPIKRIYGSVVPKSLVQKKLEEQPVIQQDDYTQKQIRKAQNERTWLSDAADFAHSLGDAAMIASNFVNAPGGRLINSFVNGTNYLKNITSNAIRNAYRKRANVYIPTIEESLSSVVQSEGGSLLETLYNKPKLMLQAPIKSKNVAGVVTIPSSGQVYNLGNNVQQELKKLNAVLQKYGYDVIPEGLDDVATRQEVLNRIAQHRTFGRGVYLKHKNSNQDQMLTEQASRAFGVSEEAVTPEMKLQTAATHTVAGNTYNARSGLYQALDTHRLNNVEYDAIYTSNIDDVMAGYSNPNRSGGTIGKAYSVRLPINDKDPSVSITQLWENNEFPLTDPYGKLTNWRKYELPYMLKTGRSLLKDVFANLDDKNVAKAVNEQIENVKRDVVKNIITYKDTYPTSRLIDRYKPDEISRLENVVKRNVAFQEQFGSAVKPIINKDERGTYLKYPREYKRFVNIIEDIKHVSERIEIKDYDLKPTLNRLKEFGIISEKQYNAFFNSLKGSNPQPDKYIDIQNMIKKAQNSYFKSLPKARKADAYIRQQDVINSKKRADFELVDKVDRIINDQYSTFQKQYEDQMRIAGVKPNTSLMSKDGYRIFTTEKLRNPLSFDNFGQHFAIIGKKDKKLLDVVEQYVPKSKRTHHGHEGPYTPGFSRNVGSIIPPTIIGTGIYETYNNY